MSWPDPDDEPTGPYDGHVAVPGRSVWKSEAIPDGSAVYLSITTGEIITYPPSKTRARRLAARERAHEEQEAARRSERAAAARRGADLARAALPRRVPPGLERPTHPFRYV